MEMAGLGIESSRNRLDKEKRIQNISIDIPGYNSRYDLMINIYLMGTEVYQINADTTSSKHLSYIWFKKVHRHRMVGIFLLSFI